MSVFTLAENDTHLRRTGAGWWAGPCPFCGGKDRFVIRETADGGRWLCRHCGDGRYQDAAAYVMKREGLNYPQALERLGEALPLRGKVLAQPEPARPIYEPPTKEWQAEAFRELDEAMIALDESEAGQAYLTNRGINYLACGGCLLGFALVYGRPAIVIPHLASIDTILSVKYRFIDNGQPRYISRRGSKPLLFNLIDCTDDRNLIVCEGELNAISIKQTLLMAADVVSTGSETIGPAVETALRNLAKRYRRRVVWMDEPEKARQVGGIVNAQLTLKSPLLDGVKADANTLLQNGLLAAFLDRALEKVRV